jgi:cardiolipin synthase
MSVKVPPGGAPISGSPPVPDATPAPKPSTAVAPPPGTGKDGTGAVKDGMGTAVRTDIVNLSGAPAAPQAMPAASNKVAVSAHHILLRAEGHVPEAVANFLAQAKDGKAALKALDGISNETLRSLTDTQLAAMLRVLDEPEDDNIWKDLLHFSWSMDRADLGRQVFRLLTAHCGPPGSTPTELNEYQQKLMAQDPSVALTPTDQGHVKAILTRMPNEGQHLQERLRGTDQSKFRNWNTRQLTPGDWKGMQDYVHSLTGTNAAPGSVVQFIANGGMAPDWPPGADAGRPDLQAILKTQPPSSKAAQDAAATLREVPVAVNGKALFMKVVDPKGSFPRILASIQNAKPGGPPVWINAFAFQSDDTGWKLAQAMAAAKLRGCDVRLAYDPFGSGHSNQTTSGDDTKLGTTDPRIYEFLRNNGVPTLPFPIGKNDGVWAQLDKDYLSHIKDYVAGSDLYMGGRNAGDEYYALWQDGLFQLNGPAVADGQKVFAEVWNYSLRTQIEREREDHKEMSPQQFDAYIKSKFGDVKPITAQDLAQARQSLGPVAGASADPYASPTVILHKGAHQDRNSRETQMAAADTATRRYAIETPYGSDPGMPASLIKAKERMGANGLVEGIFPAFNDMSEEYYAMQVHYAQLLAKGVKVYEYTGRPMNHSKLEVADDMVVGGSSNMDARSWEYNNENIFMVKDPKVANDVWARFEDDKAHAIEITPAVLKERAKGDAGLMRQLQEDFWGSKLIRGEV